MPSPLPPPAGGGGGGDTTPPPPPPPRGGGGGGEGGRLSSSPSTPLTSFLSPLRGERKSILVICSYIFLMTCSALGAFELWDTIRRIRKNGGQWPAFLDSSSLSTNRGASSCALSTIAGDRKS